MEEDEEEDNMPNNKEVFIGIDFSLKSPAICIYHNNHYQWLSHCSKIDRPKKDSKIQLEISELPDVHMEFQDELLTGNDYSSNDSANITNYRNHADEMLKLILNKLNNIKGKPKLIIGFEGYSFNSFSSSNNIIDIVAATTTFKNKILDKLKVELKYNLEVEIIAPATLKKFAGYSKFDKVDLFDIFNHDYTYILDKWTNEIQKDKEKRINKGKESVFNLNYIDKDLSGPFYSYCLNLELNRNLKKIKVPKPIDDMIDAYFVCNWLRSKTSKG